MTVSLFNNFFNFLVRLIKLNSRQLKISLCVGYFYVGSSRRMNTPFCYFIYSLWLIINSENGKIFDNIRQCSIKLFSLGIFDNDFEMKITKFKFI